MENGIINLGVHATAYGNIMTTTWHPSFYVLWLDKNLSITLHTKDPDAKLEDKFSSHDMHGIHKNQHCKTSEPRNLTSLKKLPWSFGLHSFPRWAIHIAVSFASLTSLIASHITCKRTPQRYRLLSYRHAYIPLRQYKNACSINLKCCIHNHTLEHC